MSERKPRALTLKQELFVRHYLGQAKGNGVEAARMAGYSGSNHVLAVTANDLLSHPIVRAQISEHVTLAGMSADECLAELTEIAGAPWRDFVIEVTNSKGDVVGVRMDLSNKVKSLEIIAKAHGLLSNQVQVSGPVMKAIVGIDLEDV